MTEADISSDMNMLYRRTRRDSLEKDASTIRLNDDADLREIYQFGRKLGQGSFGFVYEAIHIATQTKWAIKAICRPAPGSSEVKMLWNEINILSEVNHAHIIHLKEVYNAPKMIYLVTELCVGGELKQLLKQKKFFTEDETRHIIASLADAVVYLHKNGIVHRDLKLENILVKSSLDEDDNGRINIKVTDFGLSAHIDGVGIGDVMMEACGTLIYMAPEMMSGRGYTDWCDVWSIGVVMYMLLCGRPPFVSKTKEKLLNEIMEEGVRFTQSIWATVSDAAKTLLTVLLAADPAYRMSAKQLLENPWITGATDVPVKPLNVLEMMRHCMEEKERAQDLSLSSSDDTSEVTPVPGADSVETAPKRDNRLRTAATSTKPTKESGSLQQDNHKKSSKNPEPAQPSTSQSHVGTKPSSQMSAKQNRPWNKKDVSTGKKPASDIRKAGNQRPSTSTSRTVPHKPPGGSKSSAPSGNK